MSTEIERIEERILDLETKRLQHWAADFLRKNQAKEKRKSRPTTRNGWRKLPEDEHLWPVQYRAAAERIRRFDESRKFHGFCVGFSGIAPRLIYP